ncbi:MAG: ABC transporter permease [Patescibacteria group bacterium]|jgi:putative ABC transport system permease protein
MRVKDSIKLSISILRANKVRTFLTSLGIIIGIASVIVIMSVGAGAQSLIINQISSQGSNLIGILPGASDKNGPPSSVLGIVVTTLKYEDAVAIKNQIPEVTAISSYNSGAGTISYQNQKSDATYNGVMADYVNVEDAELLMGRFFTQDEEKGNTKVVVIGYSVWQDLFDGQDPIGKKIKIKKDFFDVIGVMKERGTVAFQNKDNLVLIPVSTAQNIMLGINYVSAIRMKVDKSENIDNVKEQVRLLLRDRHNIDSTGVEDFSIMDPRETIDILKTVTDALSFFLAAIAGISLIVGGMGVMNIMLASINERIREIGLRKAIGAHKRDIVLQFLLESMSITILGGILGIIIGATVSFLIAVIAKALGYNWDYVVTPSSVFLGIGVAILIGFIFGIYPAQRASKLDPIEALRYE